MLKRDKRPQQKLTAKKRKEKRLKQSNFTEKSSSRRACGIQKYRTGHYHRGVLLSTRFEKAERAH